MDFIRIYKLRNKSKSFSVETDYMSQILVTEVEFNLEYLFLITLFEACFGSFCVLPRLDLVFERSIMALLLGLLSTDLFASEISAVTRVIVILGQ